MCSPGNAAVGVSIVETLVGSSVVVTATVVDVVDVVVDVVDDGGGGVCNVVLLHIPGPISVNALTANT